ncbi:DUF4303 domain-containing protein [Paenibacillus guangzhouensis]|uniref:DUF4303 domain-containing protein n=1 Tax=Paenibacillus guangzhouensis TaxID=1473112 RepID=UPI001266A359|nr:DUF4303 domain-containing protein [Paenibacillus guangzhouensis]
MDFDFSILRQEIKTAAMQAFAEMNERCSEEQVIAFALYSDEGAMTVCPAVNTDIHLDRMVTGNAEDALYFKYEPAEWKFEGQGAEEAFGSICSQLRSFVLMNGRSSSHEDGNFEAFREELYETCIGVLEELVCSGFFARYAGRDIIVLFAVSDYEYEPEWYMRMIQRLNADDAVRKECEVYVKEWGD